MSDSYKLSRRSLLSMLTLPLAAKVATAADSHLPIGLELYSVRDELSRDLPGTVQAVAKMGYQCVEFFGPYYAWTPDYARQVRHQLDDLGIKCYSTHNDFKSFTPDGMGKAIDLNQILGTHYIVMAHPGNVKGIDGWRHVADVLNKANAKFSAEGLHAGYHNHDAEWRPVEGQRPMDVLASNTESSVMLQFDVGTCIEAGSDPIAWVKQNPGRIRSLHLKDWSPENKYKVLFGEGIAPWKPLLAVAESVGGAEFLLIEQEGSRFPELETAQRCLTAYKTMEG